MTPNKSRVGPVVGIIAIALTTIAVMCALFYGGYLTGGTDSSHMEGLDYADYGWYLAIPVGFVILLVVISVFLAAKLDFKGKKNATKKAAVIWIAALTFVGCLVTGIYAGYYVRAYHDSANIADVTLQLTDGTGQATLDLGNYSVLTASIEEYHARDESMFDKIRLVSFDDKWRVVVKVNNTAYWNETNQNLTGVTATLQGYSLPSLGETEYKSVTGLYAPVTQIGAANYGDIDTLNFEGITRDPRINVFEFKVINSDGDVLGTGYVHPQVELKQLAWFMDTSM